LDVCRKRV